MARWSGAWSAAAAAALVLGCSAEAPSLLAGAQVAGAVPSLRTAGQKVPEPVSLGWFGWGGGGDDASTEAPAAPDEPTDAPPEGPTEEPLSPVPLPGLPPSLSENSTLTILGDAITDQLHKTKYQWTNALAALVFGGVLVVHGETAFRTLLVVGVFLMVCLLGHYEINLLWDLDEFDPLGKVVSITAGLVAALVANRALDGLVLVVAASFGGTLAYISHMFFLHNMGWAVWGTNQWLLLIWYTLFIQVCVLATSFKRHVGLLAVVTPFVGGALVTSAVCWGLTEAALRGKLEFKGASPEPGDWVDFFVLLYSPTAKDVGLYANSPYNMQMSGTMFPTDRIFGCVLWLALFLCGMAWQIRLVQKIRKARFEERAMRRLGQGSNSNGRDLMVPLVKSQY